MTFFLYDGFWLLISLNVGSNVMSMGMAIMLMKEETYRFCPKTKNGLFEHSLLRFATKLFCLRVASFREFQCMGFHPIVVGGVWGCF